MLRWAIVAGMAKTSVYGLGKGSSMTICQAQLQELVLLVSKYFCKWSWSTQLRCSQDVRSANANPLPSERLLAKRCALRVQFTQHAQVGRSMAKLATLATRVLMELNEKTTVGAIGQSGGLSLEGQLCVQFWD